MSRVMGWPGKPDGMDGSNVASYYEAGRIDEIADYCRGDVLNTYRIWLRYELFRGRLTKEEFAWSDTQAAKFISQAELRDASREVRSNSSHEHAYSAQKCESSASRARPGQI